MSEENAAVEVPEEVPAEPSANPIEDEARSKGWDPEKGDKSAEEFLDFEEDYAQRTKVDKKLAKENKDLRHRLDRLEGNQNIQLAEQQKFLQTRITQLAANRDAAMEAGEGDMAKEIQKQMEGEQQQLAQLYTTVAPPAPTMDTTVIDNWVDQNEWIEDGSEKAQFAKDLFQELNDEMGRKTPVNAPQSRIDSQWRRILRQVNREVAEEYGEETAPVRGSRKKAPTSIRGKKTAPQAVSTRNIRNLRSEDKKMYKLMVKSDTNPMGTHTYDEFFKELDPANAKRGVA